MDGEDMEIRYTEILQIVVRYTTKTWSHGEREREGPYLRCGLYESVSVSRVTCISKSLLVCFRQRQYHFPGL